MVSFELHCLVFSYSTQFAKEFQSTSRSIVNDLQSLLQINSSMTESFQSERNNVDSKGLVLNDEPENFLPSLEKKNFH